MLNDERLCAVQELARQTIVDIQQYRKDHDAALHEVPADDIVQSLLATLDDETRALLPERNDTNLGALDWIYHLAWLHHAAALGPPCWNCGRNLRTPRANYCPECMAMREKGKFAKPL